MSLATKITFIRIIASPVFFIIYMLPKFFPDCFVNCSIWMIPVLWLVFIGAELTDMFDGMAARKRNETTDFGKFFDPFADTLFQLSIFFCFVLDGIFPAFLFLLVIYREFCILFIRNLMMKKNIVMGARMSGKVKTVTYITAGTFALVSVSIQRLNFLMFLFPWFKIASIIIFSISVVISIISFFDYLNVYLKTK
jgi:CDP-diacylglycerol--glycerol-3-phosphate 3-phosphatidyltransferase